MNRPEPMTASIRVAKMKRPEKADRTRSDRVKDRDNQRSRARRAKGR